MIQWRNMIVSPYKSSKEEHSYLAIDANGVWNCVWGELGNVFDFYRARFLKCRVHMDYIHYRWGIQSTVNNTASEVDSVHVGNVSHAKLTTQWLIASCLLYMVLHNWRWRNLNVNLVLTKTINFVDKCFEIYELNFWVFYAIERFSGE